jgi:predicted dehydrogenase
MLAKKYSIPFATSDYREINSDPEVQAVAITVRHNLHSRMTVEALLAGKHVFVEKPLGLTLDELQQIESAYAQSGKTLTVGFNRRFSPFAIKAKQLVGDAGPINVVANINAGNIPSNSWVHDMQVGGGRIIGEACHFIDLISFFANSHVAEVLMTSHGLAPKENTDNASIVLKYKNGSLGVINYFSNGNKAYSKERIELYFHGKTIILDNFRKMKCYGFSTSGMSKSQDKGHGNQFKLWQERLSQGGPPLIDFADLMNTSRASILAVTSLSTGSWMKV